MSASALKNWFLAFRPKTLSAAVVPVAVGTALAKATHQRVDWVVVGCALGVALFIQIATNLFNDAIDFKKGSDTKERIGPVRVTQAGLISPRWVFAGGVLFLLGAVGFGVPLIVKGGIVIAVLGALSLFFAYGYTGGLFPLAYHGLGDLFVMLFFGLVAVGGCHYLHVGDFDWRGIVAGLQSGATATLILAVNNLRDVHQDRAAQKKTLPVRFGVAFGRVEICLFAFSPLYFAPYWYLNGWTLAALLPLLTLPVAIVVVRGALKNEPGPIYNRFLGLSALHHLLGGALLATGLALG